jgi:hypothetical protein
VDYDTGHADLSALAAGAAPAVPVAVYLLSIWALHVRPHRPGSIQTAAYPLTAVLVLAAAATPMPQPLIALLLVGLLITFMLTTPGNQTT